MLFEWLDGGRCKPDLVERSLTLAKIGQFQVPQMNRVKQANKDT